MLQAKHGTNHLSLDDEQDSPAYSVIVLEPDYQGDFPEPTADEEDLGIDHYLNAVIIMDFADGP